MYGCYRIVTYVSRSYEGGIWHLDLFLRNDPHYAGKFLKATVAVLNHSSVSTKRKFAQLISININNQDFYKINHSNYPPIDFDNKGFKNQLDPSDLT